MKGQFIYKIVNTANGKFYVGSTTNTRERFRVHRNRLRTNKHHTQHLQAAWNKYGEQAFVFHVIETIPDTESLETAEQRWLDEHVGKEHCYNTSLHVNAPWRGITGKDNPMYGKKRSEETKQRLREARLNQTDPRIGKSHTQESIQKMVATRKANGKASGKNHYRYGQQVSEETRKKIGDSQRGVKKEPRVYTPEGLERAKANMLKNAKEQKPSDFGAVKAKFPQEVLDKYDFTNAVYTGALTRIEGCKCPIHGLFSQYAAQFRKGRGCPECGAEKRAESKRQQMKEFWATEHGRNMFTSNRKTLAP